MSSFCCGWITPMTIHTEINTFKHNDMVYSRFMASKQFDEQVGESVRRLRLAKDWSQSELAEKLSALGVSVQQQTILKIEKGTRPLKFDEACIFADLFGVSVGQLSQAEGAESEALAEVLRSNRDLQAARTERELLEAQLASVKDKVQALVKRQSDADARFFALRIENERSGHADGQH